MTKTMDTTRLVKGLVAALNEHERAKAVVRAGDNPFKDHDLPRLLNQGMGRSADNFPAKNVAELGEMGYDLEVERNKVLREAKADKSAKRMAAARARAERKRQFDKIADAPVVPSQARMDMAWLVVFHMVTIVKQIAKSKQRWASRFLGSNADDIPQMALEKMALVLAKSDKDLDLMRKAAQELGEHAERTQQIPGDQDEEERKERKEIAKARKWLMGMANNRVMGALVDSYTDQRNLRWDNLDLIATVMASINGVGDDPLLARFKADRAPAFLGTKFQKPGGMDANVLAMAIAAAITERGLDPMVEFLLDAPRTDGAIPWTERAEDIFKLTPGGDGEWMWQAVVAATTGRMKQGGTWTMDRARAARGKAARLHVQSLFEWLPGFVISVVEACDWHPIGFAARTQGGGRYIMASDFELFYRGDEPELRQMLSPALRFGTAEEAAMALTEHLAALVTGEDLVRSAVNA